jgi:hypothetical protein
MKVPTFTSQVRRTTDVGAQRMGIQASPQAASRGARAQAQFFDQVSRLGQTYLEAEYRAKNKAQEMEARNGAQRELNQAALVTEELSLTSPGEAEVFWKNESGRIKNRYSGLIENDELRQQFELLYDSNVESQSVGIRKGIRNQVIQRGQAAFVERETDLALRSSKGDMLAFKELFGDESSGTGGLYAEASQYGYLSPQQAAERKLSQKRDVVKQQIYNTIDNAGNSEELQELLDGLDDNPPAELMPSTVMSIGDAIRSDIRSIDAAKNEAVRVAKAINKDLSDEKRAGIESVFDQAKTVEEAQALLTNIIANQANLELLTNSDLRAIKTYGRSTVSRLKTEQTSAVTALGSTIRDLNNVMSQGIDPGRDQIVAVSQAVAELGTAGSKLQPKISALADSRDYMLGLRQMDPIAMSFELEQQRANAEKATGQQQLVEVEKLKIAQQFATNMRTALKNDAIAWAAKVGVINELPPLIPNTYVQDGSGGVALNQEFFRAVGKRLQASNLVAQKYSLTTAPIFTQPEKDVYKDALENGSTSDRLQILDALVRGFGSRAPDALAELSNEKGAERFGYIGGLMVDGRMAAATDALQGMDIIKNSGAPAGFTPSLAEPEFLKIVGPALGNNTVAEGAAYDVASAIYAKRIQGRNKGIFMPKIWDESVQAAFGGVNGLGGIDEVNGVSTILPSQMTAGDVENALNSMTIEQINDPEISGQVVRPTDIENFGSYKLVPIVGGKYYVYRGDWGAAKFKYVTDVSNGVDNPGDPLVIDIEAWHNKYGGAQ